MTKQEWLSCKDLKQLLNKVKSDRKKQLFALACCRSIEYLMQDQRSKDCLEKIELFVDGKISEVELELARRSAWTATAAWTTINDATDAAYAAYYAAYAIWSNYAASWAARKQQSERLKQIDFLRDIYNPFLLDLKFSEQAISLAEQVYNKDYIARGVLSDCLEDEGYPDEIVLHLKSGFHPKGCWLIDQILEKS